MNSLLKILGKNLIFVCSLLVMASITLVGCELDEDESSGSEKGDSNDALSDKGNSIDDDDIGISQDDEESNNDSDKNDEPETQTDDQTSDQNNNSDTNTADKSDQTEDADGTNDISTTAGNDCYDIKSEFDRHKIERDNRYIECNEGTYASVSDELLASGKLIDIPYHLEGFSKISIGCTFSVEVQLGTGFSVVVTVDDNLQEFVNVYQEADWLFIDANTDGHRVKGATIRAVVTMPSLTELRTSGVNSVFVSDTDDTADAELIFDISGVSALWGCIDVSSLDMSLIGTSHSRLSGTADELQLTVTGMAEANLTDLEAQRAWIDIDGVSYVEVAFLESLNGDVFDMGQLCYSGDSSLVNVTNNNPMTNIKKCED